MVSGCVPVLVAMGAATAVMYDEELLDPDSWVMGSEPKKSKISVHPLTETSRDSSQSSQKKVIRSIVSSEQDREKVTAHDSDLTDTKRMTGPRSKPKLARVLEQSRENQKKLEGDIKGFSDQETEALQEPRAALAHQERAKPNISTNNLIGLDRSSIVDLIGSPNISRNEAPGEIWLYKGSSCVMHIFLYASSNPQKYRVKHVEYRSNNPATLDEKSCLQSFLARSTVQVN